MDGSLSVRRCWLWASSKNSPSAEMKGSLPALILKIGRTNTTAPFASSTQFKIIQKDVHSVTSDFDFSFSALTSENLV